jgi:hypothetical protein
MPTPEKLGAMIFVSLLLLIGSATVFWAGRRVWCARRSRHWPRADGMVTCSEAREDIDNDGRVWFAPHVEYSFEVGGRTIIGSDLMFGFLNERFATRAEAEKRADMFPVGATLPVVHHPDKADNCVLEPKLDAGIYGVLIFGIVLGVFTVEMLRDIVFLGP